VVSSKPRPHLPAGRSAVPIVQEAGWAPEPVWTQRLEGKSSTSVGDRTSAVQPVVRHCTDRAARLTFSIDGGMRHSYKIYSRSLTGKDRMWDLGQIDLKDTRFKYLRIEFSVKFL
jgi:hypothetical protein